MCLKEQKSFTLAVLLTVRQQKCLFRKLCEENLLLENDDALLVFMCEYAH